MNNYFIYGNNINNLINNSQYTFITAFGEFIGMFLFIFLLIGSIANINLKKSKAHTNNGFGWIVLGIAIGLFIALITSFGIQFGIFKALNSNITLQEASNMVQLNLNPALVISSIIKGSLWFNNVGYIPVFNGLIYMIFELLGSILGAFTAFLFFKRLMVHEDDFNKLQSCFYTSPSIKKIYANIFNEFFATFVFVLAIISINIFITNVIAKVIIVSLIVMGIGYGLGGVTGYALNPFRDLGPRITYWIIYRKKDLSIEWNYSFVPIVAPILGSFIATLIMPGWLY